MGFAPILEVQPYIYIHIWLSLRLMVWDFWGFGCFQKHHVGCMAMFLGFGSLAQVGRQDGSFDPSEPKN